jgi:hypothetical protein
MSELGAFMKSMGVTDYATPTKEQKPKPRSPRERPVLREMSSNIRITTPENEAMKNNANNVGRFWKETKERQGKPRENPLRKKNRNGAPDNFVPPKRPEDAKAMWENMAKDLDKRLSKAKVENGSENKPRPPSSKASGMGRRGPSEQPEVEDFLGPLPSTRQSAVYSNEQASARDLDPMWKMSIRELKAELVKLGETTLPSWVSEKAELVQMVKDVEARVAIKQAFKKKEDAERREKRAQQAHEARVQEEEEKKNEVLREKIVKEVALWSKGKNIKTMLNDVNELKTPTKALSRQSTLTPVQKAYRKAMLKVHPDKNMGDFKKHARATEMFKHISESFDKYKEELKEKKVRRAAPSYPTSRRNYY